MESKQETHGINDIVKLAMDSMKVAASITDARGNLLYYNSYAGEILDRASKYIGSDIHQHHQKPSTNEKLDRMFREFEAGRKEPFRYEAKPYGEAILVTLSPIIAEGRFIGCIQTVILKRDAQLEQ